MNDLVYDFSCHGMYYSDKRYLTYIETVLFMIGRVGIDCNNSDGKIMSVTGNLPLAKATREIIDIPACSSQEQYRVQFPIAPEEYIDGIGYNYFDYFPESEKYFVTDVTINKRVFKRVLTKISYDEENKIILLGTRERNEKVIEINRNIIFGFDEKNNLKYILLRLDRIIK